MLTRMLDQGPFRLIGIGLSDISAQDDDAPVPTDLFGAEQADREDAEAATDRIRARFGKDAIIRGRALR